VSKKDMGTQSMKSWRGRDFKRKSKKYDKRLLTNRLMMTRKKNKNLEARKERNNGKRKNLNNSSLNKRNLVTLEISKE